MTILTQHALRVYSSLTALKGGEGDVLDSIIPFFEPILQVMNGKVFEPKLLALGVRRMYGWHFTREVAEQFIPRLQKKGILTKHSDGRDSTYIVSAPTLSLPDDTDDIKTVFDTIISEFASFPPIITDLLNYTKDRDELADILIRFLVASHGFGQVNGSGEGAKEPTNDLLNSLPEGGRPLNENDRYMAARFIEHITEVKPEYEPYLSRLASIGLLSEVVDDFVRPTTQQQNSDLTIILDAPLALDYLGLSGTALQADIRSVLDALRNIGCSVSVFPTTCEEMSRNLKAMLSLSPEARHGYTHGAMLKGEVRPDYVNAVAANPETALENAGISVRHISLQQYPNTHKHFTDEMMADFLATIQWGADLKPREHDAECLALLMRLREGRHSSDLFKCRYVFATRNPTFVRRSRSYCLQSHLLYDTQEGPIVHQRELATVAWLRTGLGASEAIPRQHLVASCNRLLQINPEVAKSVRDTLREFQPDTVEQFQLLLLDHRSVRKLADATLNDEKVVTGDNAAHLLDLMRNATAEEVRAEYEQKQAEDRKKHRASQRASRMKFEQEIAERERHINALEAEKNRLEAAQELEQNQRREAINLLVDHVNSRRRAFDIAVGMIVLIVGIALVINLFVDYIEAYSPWGGYLLAAVGVFGIFQSLSEFFDRPVWTARKLSSIVTRLLIRREVSRRGLVWLTAGDIEVLDGKAVCPQYKATLLKPISDK